MEEVEYRIVVREGDLIVGDGMEWAMFEVAEEVFIVVVTEELLRFVEIEEVVLYVGVGVVFVNEMTGVEVTVLGWVAGVLQVALEAGGRRRKLLEEQVERWKGDAGWNGDGTCC